MTNEVKPGQGGEQSLNQEPLTLEQAQLEITQALSKMHKHRRIIDDVEALLNPPYEKARDQLKYLLGNLPEEVACVSVNTEFSRVTEESKREFPGYLGSSLLFLQFMLAQIDPAIEVQNSVNFEFVIQPNIYPNELKRLHFGSRSRDLENEVFETMCLNYDFGHDRIIIKPNGELDIMGSTVKPFAVPVHAITAITLHREQKHLTPYLQGTDRQSLRAVPVRYS